MEIVLFSVFLVILIIFAFYILNYYDRKYENELTDKDRRRIEIKNSGTVTIQECGRFEVDWYKATHYGFLKSKKENRREIERLSNEIARKKMSY